MSSMLLVRELSIAVKVQKRCNCKEDVIAMPND